MPDDAETVASADEIYLKLYELASALMRRFDPCRISGSACLVGNPNPCCTHTAYNGPDDDLCPHMSPSGCTMPNLNCRVWICDTAMSKADPAFVEAIKGVERAAIAFGFIKPPYFGDRYYGADRPRC